jgi:hypothetical protein
MLQFAKTYLSLPFTCSSNSKTQQIRLIESGFGPLACKGEWPKGVVMLRQTFNPTNSMEMGISDNTHLKGIKHSEFDGS